MFTFSGLDRKYLFGKFGPKIENCLFKMKFGTKINLNMLSSMMMFIFLIWTEKYPFRPNSSKKPKLSIADETWHLD